MFSSFLGHKNGPTYQSSSTHYDILTMIMHESLCSIYEVMRNENFYLIEGAFIYHVQLQYGGGNAA